VAITTNTGATSSDATTLVGTDGADSFAPVEAKLISIQGLEGKDTISVSTAVEQYQVEGDAGADSIVFGILGTSTISGGDGNDTINLTSTVTNVKISSGTGVDDVDFSGGKAVTGATVNLGTGNDFFNTASGNTTTDSYFGGGKDNDTLTFVGDLKNTTVRGGKQDDTIVAAKITGSKVRGDNDEDSIQVTGVAATSYILGDAGADTINVDGLAATSTIRGGKGDDVIAYDGVHTSSTTGALIKGDAGADSIIVGANAASDDKHTIYGGLGKDTIKSEPTSAAKGVLVYGGLNEGDAADGADEITTYAAGDTIYGAAGKDVIDAGAGNNLVKGGADNDSITTTTGNDTIHGGAGDDTINIGTGADNISGDAGADVFKFAYASLTEIDTFNGGEGTDIAFITDGESKTIVDTYWSSLTNIETVSIDTAGDGAGVYNFGPKAQAEGITTINLVDNDASTGVKTVDASAYTSTVGLTIDGRDGVDVDDILKGGAGADSITSGKEGATVLTGNAGIDTFTIQSAQANTSITDIGNGGAETVIINSGAAGADLTTASTGWTASATSGNNSSTAAVDITGGAADADINLSAIVSSLYGFNINGFATGDQELTGSLRADSIFGDAGADTLTGGGGGDSLNGEAGIDVLVGGGGNDFFIYSGTVAAANANNITEFVVADDTITFTAADSAGSAGNLTVAAQASLPNGAGAAAQYILVDTDAAIQAADESTAFGGKALAFATDTGKLYYDADGNFSALEVIIGTVTTLTGTPSTGDFVLV
jgi:Ca2+-binding RTX toxin-like protein